jgi:hypothetical protein
MFITDGIGSARSRWSSRVALSALIAAGLFTPAAAAPEKVSKPGVYSGYATAEFDGVERSSFYIPMRDGTKLAADLFRPTRHGKVVEGPFPTVWMHTPYNRRVYRGGPAAERYPGYAQGLVKYGYNVAVVDFRGLFASYGRNTAYNRGEWVDAARMDAYDVTEWFARQPWSTPRIGMWGCSATGGSQMQAASTRPPSLKAIIPMSAEFDAYPFAVLGGVSSAAPSAAPGAPAEGRDAQAVAVDGPQGAAMLAEAIAQHANNIESAGPAPFRDSVSQALGETWWVKSSPSTYVDALKASGIGVYAVANWDEAGTRHGAFLTANNLPNAKLLVGPSTHCNWSDVKATTGFDLLTEELRFYDYWLKGVQNGVMQEAPVTYFTYNTPSERQWRTSASWPLKQEVRTDFFFGEGSLQAKATAKAADPVTVGAPAGGNVVSVEASKDGVLYQTDVLSADLQVTGHPVMRLWVRSDRPDVDVTARLEDVAPDGTVTSPQMIGRLRASQRALAKAPYNALGLPWHSHRSVDAQPLAKGRPQELAFEMLPVSYVFKAGHRLRVRLTFTEPAAGGGQGAVAVLRGGPQASRLVLPVIPAHAQRSSELNPTSALRGAEANP